MMGAGKVNNLRHVNGVPANLALVLLLYCLYSQFPCSFLYVCDVMVKLLLLHQEVKLENTARVHVIIIVSD